MAKVNKAFEREGTHLAKLKSAIVDRRTETENQEEVDEEEEEGNP